MVYFEFNQKYNEFELYFEDVDPDFYLKKKMRSLKLRKNTQKKCWCAKKWNDEGVKFIIEYCEKNEINFMTNLKPEKTLEFKPIENKRCCYGDSITNFFNENESTFIEKMKSNFLEEHVLNLSELQIEAWLDSFRVMQDINLNSNINIIFEYVIPYESGRRPDIILLSKEHLVILEFKMKNKLKKEDIDQVNAYSRDLREYHYESRNKLVIPILVLTKTKNLNEKIDNVLCISSDSLQKVLDNIYSDTVYPDDLELWLSSKYEPLPTIIQAARNFMKHNELPNIRRVNSTCIPQALENLKKLTDYARNNKKHVISFVTGVPGAGKTYLGLQYVYDIENVNSIYLSGNKPLIDVLEDALDSNTFVRNIHKIINEYLYYGAHEFNKNIIVFDEGQRAWDRNRMQSRNVNFSEPDILIKLCEDRLEWCVLLILVGEGQEINKGENSGIILWNNAINSGNIDWKVCCPPKLINIFKGQSFISDIDNESFDLTISLRSHISGCVSKFVNYFIAGNIEEASKLSSEIYSEGYNMYCTRNLVDAKLYCRNRYENEPDKKYGLIASSKDNILKNYGMFNDYNSTKNVDFGKWFNAPSSDSKSCCALKQTITEFGIQGLELDMPIIGWETDMIWNGRNWDKYNIHEDENSDINTYRRNTYRVLLTRGRDGFIIFVPDIQKLDGVFDVLKASGINEL